MEKIGVKEFRRNLATYLEKPRVEHTRVIVTRGGKPIGAFVSVEDFEDLERLEDERDRAIFAEVMSEGKFRPLKDVKVELFGAEGDESLSGNDLSASGERTQKTSGKISASPRKSHRRPRTKSSPKVD